MAGEAEAARSFLEILGVDLTTSASHRRDDSITTIELFEVARANRLSEALARAVPRRGLPPDVAEQLGSAQRFHQTRESNARELVRTLGRTATGVGSRLCLVDRNVVEREPGPAKEIPRRSIRDLDFLAKSAERAALRAALTSAGFQPLRDERSQSTYAHGDRGIPCDIRWVSGANEDDRYVDAVLRSSVEAPSPYVGISVPAKSDAALLSGRAVAKAGGLAVLLPTREARALALVERGAIGRTFEIAEWLSGCDADSLAEARARAREFEVTKGLEIALRTGRDVLTGPLTFYDEPRLPGSGLARWIYGDLLMPGSSSHLLQRLRRASRGRLPLLRRRPASALNRLVETGFERLPRV